jgi:hypothetical protein
LVTAELTGNRAQRLNQLRDFSMKPTNENEFAVRLGSDFIRQLVKLFVREPAANGEVELLTNRLDAETRATACFGISGGEQVIQPQWLAGNREMFEIIDVAFSGCFRGGGQPGAVGRFLKCRMTRMTACFNTLNFPSFCSSTTIVRTIATVIILGRAA